MSYVAQSEFEEFKEIGFVDVIPNESEFESEKKKVCDVYRRVCSHRYSNCLPKRNVSELEICIVNEEVEQD